MQNSANTKTRSIDGWRTLAFQIVLKAIEDACAGDTEAWHSLQPGEFCHRLLEHLHTIEAAKRASRRE